MLKESVLRRDEDFNRIYKRGRSTVTRYLVLFYMRNNKEFNRTAFLASKKVGNSVKRNRARRLMREAYRHLLPEIKEGNDLIIIARNGIVDLKEMDVEKSLKDCLIRARVLK